MVIFHSFLYVYQEGTGTISESCVPAEKAWITGHRAKCEEVNSSGEAEKHRRPERDRSPTSVTVEEFALSLRKYISGKHTKTMENHHRNSEFSHE